MQKVMRAMNMIASIKLRKLFPFQDSLKLFDSSLEKIRGDIFSALHDSDSPLIAGYPYVSRVHIIMFTADKGLCGAHNSSVQKAAGLLAEEKLKKGFKVEFSCIGTKGAHYCNKKDYEIFQQAEINERAFTREELEKIARTIYSRFVDNDIQKVYAVGNIYHSTLFQETTTLQLLPLYRPRAVEDGESGEEAPEESNSPDSTQNSEYISMDTDPEGNSFVQSAAELYLQFKLQSMLLNSYLSEHSSRMTAMENATNNSEDLVNKYITMQNHARQASITNELIEIVSGKEAMKG